MKKLSLSVLVLSFISLSALAQNAEQKNVPANTSARISMNVTVPKQAPAAVAQPVRLQGGALPGGSVVSNARQTPNTSFGEKVNAGKQPVNQVSDDRRTYTGGRKVETSALVSGQPIGGIVVKGGQNPRPR